MAKLVLTIEEMDELTSLGVDTSDASMFYTNLIDGFDENEYDLDHKRWEGNFESEVDKELIERRAIIPAYTLEDLLKKLPKRIIAPTKQNKSTVFKLATIDERVMYMQGHVDQQCLKRTYGEDLMQAAFRMLVWVYTKGKDYTKEY